MYLQRLIKIGFLFVLIVSCVSVLAKPKSLQQKTKNSKARSRMLASNKERDPKIETIARYLDCYANMESQKNMDAIETCANKELAPDLSKAERRHFLSWPLAFAIEVNSVDPCNVEDIRNADLFPNKTGIHICANAKIAGEEKRLIFYFKGSNLEPRLSSVFY